MSCTTGTLFHKESVDLASMYLDLGNWDAVRQKVLTGNLLQTRTLNTLKRVTSEVISRLKTLGHDELAFLVAGTHQEQAYLLWVAVCRRYRFIADFAVAVLRERYLSLMLDLSYEDYDSFFNRTSEWHPELEAIKPATRYKLRQVIFKMLREADLLTESNLISAAMLSPRLVGLLSQVNAHDLMLFPVFESDVKRGKQ